jgi:hypothetical protein
MMINPVVGSSGIHLDKWSLVEGALRCCRVSAEELRGGVFDHELFGGQRFVPAVSADLRGMRSRAQR